MSKNIVVSGKRKRAVARGSVKEGSGKILINKKPYESLSEIRRLMLEEPLRIAKEVLGDVKFNISINTKGGGQEARIEASRLVIAKALIKATKSEKLRKAFLAYDRNLLVADTRRKEPYKPGDSKARKKRQKSYR